MRDVDGWNPRAYELWFTANPLQAAIRRREREAIWSALALRLRAGDRVLEVGPGTGVHTRELARRAREVIAVEPSAAMREHLRAQLRAEPGVQVREGALPAALPAIPPVDGALAAGVLNYLRDTEAALAGLASRLRPGGWIVLTIPLRSPGGLLYLAGETLTRRRIWLHSEDSLGAAARAAGIEPEEIRPVGLSARGFILLLAGRRA